LGAELESTFTKSFTEASNDFKELMKNVKDLSKTRGSSNITKPVRDDLKKTQEEMRKTEKTSESMISLLKKAGVVLTGVFAAGTIVGFGKDLVQTYAGFEQGMANVRAVSGLQKDSDEFSQLSAKAREMGERTSKTASEAADGLQYLALAGWNTEQMLAGIEPVLRLSEAGNLDLGRASDLATDSMAALGVKVNELPGYLDKVAQTSRRSNTSVEQLMDAFLVAGGTFKTFNVPLEEANALLGIMANRGYKGSEAGTAMNAIVTNMTSGAGQAGKAMKELNISAFDSKGKFKGLENVFREVKGKIDKMTDSQKAQYIAMIAGKEHLKTFTGILDGLGGEYGDLKKQVSAADGALMEMADTQMDTFLGSMKLLDSAVESAKISLGEKMAPAIRWVADLLSTTIPKAMETAEAFFLKTGEFITPFIESAKVLSSDMFEDAKTLFSPLVEGIKEMMGESFSTLQELMPQFGDYASEMLPYLTDAFQSLGVGIQAVIPYFLSFIRAWQQIATKLITVVAPIFKYIAGKVIPLLSDAIAFVYKTVVPKLAETFQTWLPPVKQIIMGLGDAFFGVWNNMIRPIHDDLYAVFQFVWPVVKDVVVVAIDTIKDVIGGLFVSLGGVIDFVAGVFTGDWARAWEGVKNVFGGIFESLVGLVKGPLNAIIALVNGVIREINKISIDVPDWVPGGGQSYGANIPEIPMLAKGAMVSSPTLAMIGEGGDDEFVIPMNNKPRSHALLASANRMMGYSRESNGGNGIVINDQRSINITGGDKDAFKQAERALITSNEDLERRIKAILQQERRLSLNG